MNVRSSKDNIKVLVRVRPLLELEAGKEIGTEV